MRAYKLFRRKAGKLYPLFVSTNTEIPIGQRVEAAAGEMDQHGKVKSKLGGLCYRPGLHCSDFPVAIHIGEKEHPRDKLPSYRPADQVWTEVDILGNIDYQDQAKAAGNSPRDQYIKDIPYNGYYRYKTNANMLGTWIIAGEIVVNRVLTDIEVEQINAAAGLHDLPRRKGA